MSAAAQEGDRMEAMDRALLLDFEAAVIRHDRASAQLSDPQRFIIESLGYQLENFHSEWLAIQIENRKTLILAPRGHGKSTICTIAYPLWRLLNNPELRILIVSNTAAQACAFLRETRSHLEANFFILDHFGNLMGRPWTECQLTLSVRRRHPKEASLTAMGVLGPVISKHYDLILLDDIVDEQNACSQRQRDQLLLWYYKTLLPCLEPDGELHLVGTRYHYLDLYGHLIANEFAQSHWTYRALNSKETIDDRPETTDGRPQTRDHGPRQGLKSEVYSLKSTSSVVPLWPEKFPVALLRQLQKDAGPAVFNSQYQNDTALMKGAIFKPNWIQAWQNLPSRDDCIIGIDLAISRETHADFFAAVAIGIDRFSGTCYVLEMINERLPFSGQLQAVQRLYKRIDGPATPVVQIAVENNGYQEAFAQELRRRSLPVKSVTRVRDKISRAYRLQPKIESGLVLFPRTGANTLIQQLLLMPEADHDDLFDALELAVSQVRTSFKDFPKKLPNVEPE